MGDLAALNKAEEKLAEENKYLDLARDQSAVCLGRVPSCVCYLICEIVHGCLDLASCCLSECRWSCSSCVKSRARPPTPIWL